MKLSECLNSADIATLRKIAEFYELPCSRHSKLALLQEIMYTFASPDVLDSCVRDWTRGREREMLRLCLEQRTVFSSEELTGIFQETGNDDVLESAVKEGWLFPTTRYGGRLQYCIPEEFMYRLRDAVVSSFADRLAPSAEGPLLYQEDGVALARDLDVFLEYVQHHDVQLTRDGAMYKRNLMQVLDLLEIREQPLQGGWRFGYGRRFHDYPDRFALLYDCAYHNRFISEDNDGRLRVTEDCSEWFAMDELERQRTLLRFYLATYRRPIKRLPQIVQLIARLAIGWIDSQEMLSALGSLVQPYYYDDQMQVWNTRILKMLVHLGLIRRGRDETGREWFQTTELCQQLLTPDALPRSPDQAKEKQRILIVQPNFDIVVTGDQPVVAAELALFAELKQAGVVRVYRLTEHTVRKGLQAGRSISAWLSFLEAHSQTPVPGNVERTLLEWERQELVQGPHSGSGDSESDAG